MLQKQFTALHALILFSVIASAQIPDGYYDSAQGKTGPELKTALYLITDNHNILSYSALWTAFEDTDLKSNGKVWDMYSDIPGGTPPYEYTYGTDQCGNYGGEGDCYNREHSVPKSWFNDASPMYTDMFHIVPTDGYVNNKRGNYPFGEVGNASWTSLNGSRVGTSDYPGYSGTVFEPIDEYKGDFARGYFYMATRYENSIAGWNSPMFDETAYPAFTEWALNLLMEWHEQDPVSDKEIARNNAIYQWQQNRNPFIDHPEFVTLIWGDTPVGLEITSLPDTTATAGENYSYLITAEAEGMPQSEITFTAVTLPDWLDLADQGNGNALLQGTPAQNHIGTAEVEVLATAQNLTAGQSFSIHVSAGSQNNTFTETFTLMPDASSAYTDRSWTGDHDIFWTATHARTDQEIDGRAICLKDDSNAYLLSETLQSGISILSFEHQQKFTGSGGTLTLYINDQPIGSPVEVNENANLAVFEGLDISEEFTLKLVSNGLSRIAIDNISWTPYQPVPQYQLVIQMEGNGTIDPEPGTYMYDENTQVVIQATPKQDWSFEKWVINGAEVMEAQTTLLLNEDITATAVFTFNTAISTEQNRAAYIPFPNPFSDSFSLRNRTDISHAALFSLTGQRILLIEEPGNSINTRQLQPGFYILKLELKSGYSMQFKVLKK